MHSEVGMQLTGWIGTKGMHDHASGVALVHCLVMVFPIVIVNLFDDISAGLMVHTVCVECEV